jgi:hypothetical protein
LSPLFMLKKPRPLAGIESLYYRFKGANSRRDYNFDPG